MEWISRFCRYQVAMARLMSKAILIWGIQPNLLLPHGQVIVEWLERVHSGTPLWPEVDNIKVMRKNLLFRREEVQP